MNHESFDKGVSPVVGIVILVGITVMLTAITFAAVSVFIDNPGEHAPAAVTEDAGVIQLVGNENADEIYLINESGDRVHTFSEIGERYAPDQAGEYTVVATQGDSKQTLNTFVIEFPAEIEFTSVESTATVDA